MTKTTLIKILGLTFFVVMLGLGALFLFNEATGSTSPMVRLAILGPMFLLGFSVIAGSVVVGKRRLSGQPMQLLKFNSLLRAVLLIYGISFLVFLAWILWDVIGMTSVHSQLGQYP
jgi:hypothetical protein